MKEYAQYISYTLSRLKAALPLPQYFTILMALRLGKVGASFIRALAGLLNTHPRPQLSVRQILIAIKLECVAKGATVQFERLIESWLAERPDVKSPGGCPCVEA